MKRAAVVVALLLMAGCSVLPRKTVYVPVSTPCEVVLPDQPVWATASLDDDATIWVQVKALLAERRQRIAYERELRAAAESCASKPTPAPLSN